VLTQTAQVYARKFSGLQPDSRTETMGYVILWKPWRIRSWFFTRESSYSFSAS